MLVDLVETWTSDGIRLDGALFDRHSAANEPAAVSAVLLLSGVGSNFYGSSLITRIAHECTAHGMTALTVNTRGHDSVSTAVTREGGRILGAAYEIVDDCRHDVTAWVEYLVARGHATVAVVGHSLGAIKALYSQAFEPHAAVTHVAAVSPPRLNHDRFRTGDEVADFHASMTRARELARAGQSDMLFRATFPFPMVLSAGTYLDKYGPESRYDFTKFADAVRSRVLFTWGALELAGGGVAFSGLVETVSELPWKDAPQVATVPDANHFYSGCHETLAGILLDYLTSAT